MTGTLKIIAKDGRSYFRKAALSIDSLTTRKTANITLSTRFYEN